MAFLEDNIRRVTVKLQQLLKQYQQLQKENSRLKQELEKANTLQVTNGETINQLRQQVAILKVAAGLMNDNDKKAFDRQINQYIKEIDKCMVMLGQ
jgi:cell shape-determining protein MreC